jgi:hypothetical protein
VWRCIAQSLQGPSHVAENSPCQDSHFTRVFGQAATETLIACVADGAGSAAFSDVGSAAACAAIDHCAAEYFGQRGSFADFQHEDALRWCDEARRRIIDEAQSRDCGTRELATTLCVAILTPSRSIFFQVGDGAIVLRRLGVYGVVFWPQSGEYVNSTNFLTTDEYQELLEFLTVPVSCTDVALLTDGLERLALRFDSQTPHPPFFEPLFRVLRATSEFAPLNDDLRKFLGGESVQIRSDDDKTLILASRIDDGPDTAA